MTLTGQMLDNLAIFAVDNGQEASHCGQDWLRDRELLALYTRTKQVDPCQEKVST